MVQLFNMRLGMLGLTMALGVSAQAAQFEKIKKFSSEQLVYVHEKWAPVKEAIEYYAEHAEVDVAKSTFEAKAKIVSRNDEEKWENTVKQWLHILNPDSAKMSVSRLNVSKEAVHEAVRDVMWAGDLTGGDAGEPDMRDDLTERLRFVLLSRTGVIAYKGSTANRSGSYTFIVVVDTRGNEIFGFGAGVQE